MAPPAERLGNSLAKAWPCAASAFLLLAAFPPFHLSLLVFVALVPWLASLREPHARGFRSGWTFGFVYFLGQMFWLVPFVSKWTQSTGLALVPWVLAGLIVAPFYGLTGWLVRICWRNGWPMLIPVVWAGVEVLRSFIPGLAFPWGLVATPLADLPPLMGLGHYGMIFLASAWCVLANVSLAQIVSGEKFVGLRGTALVCLAGFALSIVYWSLPPTGDTKTMVAVQPGVDLAFGDPATETQRVAVAVDPLLIAAKRANPALAVLPEGICGDTLQMPPRAPFALDPGLPVVFGGERGSGPRYQAAFGYDGGWTYADKTRLVIFGEFVPGRTWIPFLSSFRLPTGDLSAASEVKSLNVNGLKVGPMLCFEGLFSDVAFRQAANGAQVLAVMSIDDWYMGTAAPEQLAQAAPWRAVETGLPVVRSASLGISLACDARGNLIAQAPIGLSRNVFAKVTLPRQRQAFLFAPLFPMLCLLSLVVVPVLHRIIRKASQVNLAS